MAVTRCSRPDVAHLAYRAMLLHAALVYSYFSYAGSLLRKSTRWHALRVGVPRLKAGLYMRQYVKFKKQPYVAIRKSLPNRSQTNQRDWVKIFFGLAGLSKGQVPPPYTP